MRQAIRRHVRPGAPILSAAALAFASISKTPSASFRVRASFRSVHDNQRQHPPGEFSGDRRRALLVPPRSAMNDGSITMIPGRRPARSPARPSLADPDIEVEPLGDLPGVFGQRELLFSEGTPVRRRNHRKPRRSRLAGALAVVGAATSMRKTGSRLSGRERAWRLLDVSDLLRFDGFDGITLRDLDDLRPHTVHHGLVQVVVWLEPQQRAQAVVGVVRLGDGVQRLAQPGRVLDPRQWRPQHRHQPSDRIPAPRPP